MNSTHALFKFVDVFIIEGIVSGGVLLEGIIRLMF